MDFEDLFISSINLSTSDDFEVDDDELWIAKPVAISTILIMCIVICVFGVFVNSMSFLMIAIKRRMQTPINLFLLNLSVADILLAIFTALFEPSQMILRTWIFGKAMCLVTNYTVALCEHFLTFTITAAPVIFLFKPRIEVQNCCRTIALLWIIAAVTAIPRTSHVLSFQEAPMEKVLFLCQQTVMNPWHQRITTVCLTWIPIIIIMVSLIAYKVAQKKFINESLNIRVSLTVAIIFVLLCIPFTLIRSIEPEVSISFEVFESFFSISLLIMMLSVVYKPFVYLWLDQNFREELKDLVPCCFKNSRNESHEMQVNEIV